MKKWLIGIAAVVVLLVVVLLVIPFTIPTATYVDEIVALTKQATGRDLTIKGKASFSLLPHVALEASDVSFSNAPGMSTPDMATIAKLQIEVQPLALLSGDLVIDRFVIVDPRIALEVDKSGRANWRLPAARSQPRPRPPHSSSCISGTSASSTAR
jgi:AsmA protein